MPHTKGWVTTSTNMLGVTHTVGRKLLLKEEVQGSFVKCTEMVEWPKDWEEGKLLRGPTGPYQGSWGRGHPKGRGIHAGM